MTKITRNFEQKTKILTGFSAVKKSRPDRFPFLVGGYRLGGEGLPVFYISTTVLKDRILIKASNEWSK